MPGASLIARSVGRFWRVRASLAGSDESVRVIGLFEKRLLPVARAQIDAARSGFLASRDPFLTVIGAEKNLRSMELDYQVARANADRHRAELDRALGRIPGLTHREDTP